MGRGGTTTVRRPLPRIAPRASAPRRAPLLAVAALCAVVGALLLAIAVVASGYVLVRLGGALAANDGENAARWATMLFATAAPLLPAYAARAGYLNALARLRGEPRQGVGVMAVAAPAAVIAGCVLLQGSLGWGSYFVTDDWLQIAIAHDAVSNTGLDLHYLGRIVYIHYAPGHRFTYWALDELAPLDWHAGIAAMLALFAGALAAFHRICVRLFGRRPSNLVLLGLFGTSVLLLPSFLWFADAVHKFPSMVLCLIAIDAYLAHRLERKRWALAVSVVAVALGSLFYVKTLLVPFYLLMISVLFLERRPADGLRATVKERWTWLAFVPVYAIYLVNYFVNVLNANEHTSAPSMHLLGKYLWLAWFRGVTPAFMGVHVGVDAQSPELLMAFAAQALLVAVIAFTLWRKRSAWRAWVFWTVAFATNAIVVALGRLGSLGLKQVGAQLRYDTEMTWLLPLALGFALFPGEVAGKPAEPGSVRVLRWPSRRVRVGLVAVAACVYLAAAIDTGSDTAREWQRLDSGQPKAYVTNMQHDAARIERSGARPETLDDQTPAFLISPVHKPWNRLERFVPAVAPELRVVPADRRPLQVRQNGQVIPIALQSLSNGTAAITGAGPVTLAGGTRMRRGGHLCARAGRRPATLRFATEKLLRGESLFARVDYQVVRGSGAVRVSGNTYRDVVTRFPLSERRGQAYLNLGHRLRAVLPAGSEVCLRSSQVGWIAP